MEKCCHPFPTKAPELWWQKCCPSGPETSLLRKPSARNSICLMISFSAMENFAKKFGKRTIRERLPAANRKEGRSQSVCVGGGGGGGGVRHWRSVGKGCWPEPALQWRPGPLGHHWGLPPRLSWRELNLLRKRRTDHNGFAHLTNSGASGLVKTAPWQVVKLSGHKGLV